MDTRRRMSMRKIIPKAITSFPAKDPRYAIFNYLLQLARRGGTNKYNNKRIETDHVELFELTVQLKPEDIKVRDYYDQTIIHLAAQYCSAEDMNLLLDARFRDEAEIDAPDSVGYTPLMYAAMANNVDTAEVLCDKKCSLEVTVGPSQRNVLHVAAMFGSKEMTRLLLQKKCDINSQDNLGLTAVALSAYYRHSDVTSFLVHMGADPFIMDNQRVTNAIRIAYSMPLITRDVFDKLCSEDILKGERHFHLDQIMPWEGDVKTSLFQFLVWQGNLGIAEHPVFKHLTEEKWNLYGQKPTNKMFGFLALYSVIWTGFYMLTETYSVTVLTERKWVHFLHLLVYLLAFASYFHRLFVNTLLMRGRHKYLMRIRKIMADMDKSEASIMHHKGSHLMEAAREANKVEKLTFINDIKKQPSLVTDLIIDHILLFYLVIKVLSNIFPFFASIENIFGAMAVISLWTNTFLKLQITKRIGPFVIFMKYVPADLWTVTTMFITLFMPALIVFYKTIFTKDGMKASSDEEVGGISKRAAAKGGKGSGGGEYEALDFVGTFFAVLRMVLVDYEYEDGMSRSTPPSWWMVVSLVWIIVSSIVVLNLMIAIMSDSYTRIYERSEITSRVRRAEVIADLEKKMDHKDLNRAAKEIASNSPIKILFDPVCDRDKIEIMDKKVQFLNQKVGRLEKTVNNKLFINLKRRLDFIETKVNIQSYKPTSGSPFFRYA